MCLHSKREYPDTKNAKKKAKEKKLKKTLNLEQKEVSVILQASPIWLTDTTRPLLQHTDRHVMMILEIFLLNPSLIMVLGLF
jgi:hypothetical protein